MKTSKIITLLFIYLCLPLMTKAQESEADRIQKDITVAENVLLELIKYPFESRRLSNLSSFIKGIYKENDNLTFNIIGFNPKGQRISYSKKDYPKKLIFKDDEVKITYQNGKKKTLTREAYYDSLRIRETENLLDFTYLFLSQYAHLLNQVPAIKTVKFVYQKKSKPFLISQSQEVLSNTNNEMTIVEITREDLILYTKKEVNEDILKQKIKIVSKKVEGIPLKSFETAMNILKKNISKYLDKDEGSIASGRFDYIEGMGVMYIVWGEGYVIHFTEKRLLVKAKSYDQFQTNDLQEQKEEQGISYADFKQKVMSDLIEYGRTLNSLAEDEQVILRFPRFNLIHSFEEAPIFLELSVEKSILSQYNQREISLEEAIKSIKVIEY